MVSFLSLFLGLVFGPQTVALEVAEPVAWVDLLLDGRQMGTLRGPAWKGPIDLGPELQPHELTAIAYDAEGVELDRVSQRLNLPRQPAEATILLEHDPISGSKVARVSWESLIDDEPSAVRAEFDGVLLEVDDPRTILLPEHDAQQLHFFRVELEFAGVLTSSAEVTFGGVYADEIHAELTALPIEPRRGRKRLPDEKDLADGFGSRDNTLRVAAVEKGLVDLVVVRDPSAWPRLRRIRAQAITAPAGSASAGGLGAWTRRGWFIPSRSDWQAWSFQFLWPTPRRHDGDSGPYDLFSHSARYLATSGSLHGWLTTVEQPKEWSGQARLADAVAIAALTAASSNRRRGVLLVLGENPEDGSEASPEMVRRYLQSLAVPLFVWRISPETAPGHAWADAVDVSTPSLMSHATRRIFRRLEAQRIVWLEGIHLPQQITMKPALAERVKTAG